MDESEDSLTRIQTSPPSMATHDDATRLHKPVQKDKTRIAPSKDRSADNNLIAPTRLTKEAANHVKKFQTLQPGTLIKRRFQLDKELGRGGMGVVYTARDLVQEAVGEKHPIVAIKLLSENFKDHPEALYMLQQETKKARELAHPNIITVYDFDRDGDLVYMTMELMSGVNLKEHLEERMHTVSTLEEVTPIINGIAAGLKYAHKKNIVHSDLKPANVFLTDDGVKILDFGIARAIMQTDSTITAFQKDKLPAESSQLEPHSNKISEIIALTPAYASLEMFLGESPDPSDDVYAFACICYQLLAGEHPYRGQSAQEAFDKGMEPKRIEGLKEAQWKAMLKGLALSRNQRAQTVEEFLDKLMPKAREPWKIAAFAVVFVAVISIAYILIRPPVVVKQNIFENPPPASEITPELAKIIEEMLEVAEVHMMVGRLLNPPDSNALDVYQEILKKHPYNRKAIAGLKSLLDRLVMLAIEAIDQGDKKKAEELVIEVLKIYPNHRDLQALKDQLDLQALKRSTKGY